MCSKSNFFVPASPCLEFFDNMVWNRKDSNAYPFKNMDFVKLKKRGNLGYFLLGPIQYFTVS